MPHLLKVSEASVLAIHTVVFLAAHREKLLSAKELASVLHASEHHLSKVLQRLVKSGFLNAARGPKGGFSLNPSREEVTMLEVFEAIEGRLDWGACLFGRSVCENGKCIFGEFFEGVNRSVLQYLSQTKIIDIAQNCQQQLPEGLRGHFGNIAAAK